MRQSERRRHISRRDLLAGAAASMFLCMTPGIVRAQSAPFRFGLTPVFLSDDLELLARLREYLSAKMGEPVELITRRTYQEITAMLVSGQVETAWICGYPYVQHRSELQLVATPKWRGQPLYQSYLIVARGRTVESWKDLQGDPCLLRSQLQFWLPGDPGAFGCRSVAFCFFRNPSIGRGLPVNH